MEKIINDYIGKTDWRVHENANTSYSISGLKSYIAASVLAKDSLSKLPEPIREAHKSGAIHLHDLDGSLYVPYCVSGSTHIQTISICKSAKHIKVGDILVGYNEKLKRFEHTKVEKVFVHEVDEIYELRLDKKDNRDVNLRITGNHKVLTNTGWKSVEELKIGDEILYLYQKERDSAKLNKEYIEKQKNKIKTHEELSEIYKNSHVHNSGEFNSERWHDSKFKETIMEKRRISGHYEKVSEYMKLHNPLFNPEVAKKCGEKKKEFYRLYPECHPNRIMSKKGFIYKPQLKLFEIVKKFYNEAILEYPIKTEKSVRFADVAIPSLKIIFEFDGEHWHNDKEKDKQRINEIKNLGWQIFSFSKENELTTENISTYLFPENGAVVLEKKLIKSIYNKNKGRKYKFKVYNFHCSPHENYLANGMIVHNCYGADLQQLLIEGLKNPVGSSSTPAKHMDTAIDHIVNYIYISQSEFNGAQAFSNVDTLLAPFVIGKDHKYVKQQIQRLIYNISYPLRSAFQTPFFNASFDIIPPEHMKNEPIVIGGKTSEELTYGDMQKEMDMINSSFLELMIGGDSNGKPFTFPIPTYGVTEELLKKDDNVTNLLYQLTAKFGSPNFQNYIKSGNDPSDVRSMCCRLSLDIAKLKSRGLWNMGNKTGSLGVVTLNLNHASKDGEKHFIENIDSAYDLAVEELLIKNKYIHEAFDRGLLPFTRQYLTHKDPFKTFFNTIGNHGMNEACINMFDTSIESNQDFVIDILKHLRHRTDETIEETGLLFNLEETPCEGATRRLAKLDKKLGLPTQGEEYPYLTNSTHCPVNTNIDWIQNVRIQEKFKPFYSGGTILNGYIGEEISPESAKHLVKQMACETKIPYYNVTPTFSHCKVHLHISGNKPICPKCGEETLVYSRVVGYLQPTIKWNDSKKEEFKDRKMYKM